MSSEQISRGSLVGGVLKKHCAMLVICAGTLMPMSLVPGCSSPPTTQEINQQYTIFRQGVWDAYNKMMEGCADLPAGEQSACRQTAREWRDARLTETHQGWEDAINENWDDARERRKQLEEELEQILPNWPDVKDLIDLIGEASGASGGVYRYVLAAPLGSQGNSQSNAPVGDPIPIEVETFSFTGTLSVDRGGMSDDAECSGSLDMHLSVNGLQSQGRIVSGSLAATFDGGHQATITVLKDSGNIISTDSTGHGQMIFLASFHHSMNEWDAILQSKIRVYLPVRIDSSGMLIIDSEDSQIEDFAGYSPFPYTDHNQDGVWDFNTDFASFLTAHAVMEDDADINRDGVWDQSDIDVWVMDFGYDQSHME